MVSALLLIVYGCDTPTQPATPEPQSADAAITSRVKSALAADPRVRAELIEVSTSNGMVRLSGFADSRLDADAAVSIANDVAGVKGVQNDVADKGKPRQTAVIGRGYRRESLAQGVRRSRWDAKPDRFSRTNRSQERRFKLVEPRRADSASDGGAMNTPRWKRWFTLL